ncbi:MAG: DnaA family protein [Cryomorphaceae bacterium]|jgi:DnaA family protein
MSPSSSTPQMALPLAHADKASFDNYWVGHNSELVTAIRASVEIGEPKVLYFYGPAGAGKSHLLFAAMRLARDEVINTSFLTLNDPFVSPDMLAVVDVEHVVCVDNIQSWAGDQDRERALFTLFEQIKHAGGQLLVSSTQPPEQAGFALRDLVSRLSSGLIYPLLDLNEEQQLEAIKLRASQRGLSISDETVKYLISRSSRDTSELFAILDKIDQASLVEKRRITIPFLQSLFRAS